MCLLLAHVNVAVVPLILQPSEKCGVLNVTKITDNGKKVRYV